MRTFTLFFVFLLLPFSLFSDEIVENKAPPGTIKAIVFDADVLLKSKQFYERQKATKGKLEGAISNNFFSIVQALKDHGYQVVLFSNGIKRDEERLQHLGYNQYFSPILICETENEKPSDQSYDLLTKKIGLPQECILMVETRQDYLNAAKQYGFETLYFICPPQLADALTKKDIDLTYKTQKPNKLKALFLPTNWFK